MAANVSTFLDIAVTRLATLSPTYIDSSRIVYVDDFDGLTAGYFGEKGIALTISPPQPFMPSGAGRRGYKVKRTLSVLVHTQSMLDVAGNSIQAAKAHLDFEERILNVLLDQRAGSQQFSSEPPLGIYGLLFSGGGQAPQRTGKSGDVGCLRSVLNFEFEYVVNVEVANT